MIIYHVSLSVSQSAHNHQLFSLSGSAGCFISSPACWPRDTSLAINITDYEPHSAKPRSKTSYHQVWNGPLFIFYYNVNKVVRPKEFGKFETFRLRNSQRITSSDSVFSSHVPLDNLSRKSVGSYQASTLVLHLVIHDNDYKVTRTKIKGSFLF